MKYRNLLQNPSYLLLTLIIVVFIITGISALNDGILSNLHPGVPLSHAILSESFVQDGFESYRYITYKESAGGLHIFALVATPFVAILGVPGSQLTSLLMGAVAIGGVYAIGTQTRSSSVGASAALLFAIFPMTLYLSRRGFPEAVDLATASWAIALTLMSTPKNSNWALTGGIIVALLGVANHLWTALVVVPMATHLFLTDRLRRAIGVIIAISLTSLATFILTQSHSSGRSLVRAYSVFYHSDLLLSNQFWIYVIEKQLNRAWTHLGGVVVGLATICAIARQRDLLFLSWLAAAAALIIFLPRGAMIHDYYFHALLPPSALLVSSQLSDIINISYKKAKNIDVSFLGTSTSQARPIALIILSLVLVASINGAAASSRLGYGSDGLNSEVMGATNQYVTTPPDDVIVVSDANLSRVEARETLPIHTVPLYSGIIIKSDQNSVQPVVVKTMEEAQSRNPQVIVDTRPVGNWSTCCGEITVINTNNSTSKSRIHPTEPI